MKMNYFFYPLLMCCMLGLGNCNGQVKNKVTAMNNNPLMCDPASGICELPASGTTTELQKSEVMEKPIQIIYFTDPICSACWGIEPQLRKLKLAYGDDVKFDCRMGGLLPGWENYNGGGISKPSDVAHHWDEASAYYGMPIDGDIWLEDPLSSSYPPSIAYKAAQLQSDDLANALLRRMREMVFMEKKNIAQWEYIRQAAIQVGIDTTRLKEDYGGKAVELFNADLDFSRGSGVRGFPTLVFIGADHRQVVLVGFKPYEAYEEAVHKLMPKAVKKEIDTSWESLFTHYPSLTAKEFSVLSGTTKAASEELLNTLLGSRKLDKVSCKRGDLWRVNAPTR